MTGERLREILKKTGKSLAEISRQMEMSSQGLNTLFKAADVRTGTLEKLCARLDMDIPDDTISLALGHSARNATTDIYIRRDLAKVDAANRRVIDYVLKRP